MIVRNWHEVHLGGVVLTGLVAGYVMTLVGLWAGRLPGLVTVDIADFGRRYMVSDRPVAWVLGLLSHLFNSMLLVFVYATVIQPNVQWPRPLGAVAFGEALAVVLAGALVAPMSGLGFQGRRTGSARFALTNLLIHAVWGALVGVLYP